MPSLVERWAARQFLTPRRGGAGHALSPGDAFAVVSGQYRLRAWSWGVGPAVLLMHGWEGHAGHLNRFVEPLVNRGFRAVALDLPAHGFSSGRQATLLDMADALCAVGDAVGPVHAVIAHSLGGAATALALGPVQGRNGGNRLSASRVVPFEHARAIAAAWPGALLRPAPGLGHRRILADPKVIAEAVSFIAEPETKEA